MTNSVDIIMKLKDAVMEGGLRAEEVPIYDLKECVRLELETNHMCYEEGQFRQVLDGFESFCSYVRDGEADESKVLMFLDGMMICLLSVSKAVLSLANYDYWAFKHKDQMDDPEVREIVEYVGRNHHIRLLNYDFVRQYEGLDREVGFDEECGMGFVIYKGRRMYFPKGMDERKIRDYFNTILAEQDAYSPHCYYKEGYEVRRGDVIVDAGGAEGFLLWSIWKMLRKFIYLTRMLDGSSHCIRRLKRILKRYISITAM